MVGERRGRRGEGEQPVAPAREQPEVIVDGDAAGGGEAKAEGRRSWCRVETMAQGGKVSERNETHKVKFVI